MLTVAIEWYKPIASVGMDMARTKSYQRVP